MLAVDLAKHATAESTRAPARNLCVRMIEGCPLRAMAALTAGGNCTLQSGRSSHVPAIKLRLVHMVHMDYNLKLKGDEDWHTVLVHMDQYYGPYGSRPKAVLLGQDPNPPSCG